MSTGAIGGALGEWGTVAAIIVSLIGGGVALYNVMLSRRFGVSGDEREARKVEQEEKRDTVADRDQQIASLLQDRSHLVERLERLNDRLDELEQREDDTRTMLMMHAAWDWQAIELARAGGVTLPPPPPLMAPRVPRVNRGES